MWSREGNCELITRIATVVEGGEESVALEIEEGYDMEQQLLCFDVLWIMPEFGTEHEFYDLLISILSDQAHELLLFEKFAKAGDNVIWKCSESHC